METKNILGILVIIGTISLVGCTSIPSKPVVLESSSQITTSLKSVEDDRPTDSRNSGKFSDPAYHGYRYGDELFMPAPIFVLDNAVTKILGGSGDHEKVHIKGLEIMDKQYVSVMQTSSTTSGVVPSGALTSAATEVLGSYGFPENMSHHLICQISGTIGTRNVSANVINDDSTDISTRLQALVSECVASFTKSLKQQMVGEKRPQGVGAG